MLCHNTVRELTKAGKKAIRISVEWLERQKIDIPILLRFGKIQPQAQTGEGGIRTLAIPGTALVGAFSAAAQLFRRTGLLVEITNANEDDFVRNLLSIRAELRAALAVYHGSAFCEVTGLP